MKKRRILSVWLLTALLLASTVTAAWAASDPGTLVFDVSEGPVTITGGATVQVSYGAGQLKSDIAPDALITLIGTTTANAVTVNAGTAGSPINIALSGVNIDVSATADACAFNMAGAAVNLFLKGDSVLKSGENKAGLNCPSGATLVIADGTADGKGKLTANGGNHGAGIGSGFNSGAAGNITINSGTVEAHGNGGGTGSGAGIGGGHNGGGGTIIINGGTVTANGSYGRLGGYGGAGIGAGNGGHGCSITINGGTINATGQGAGIGSGYTGTAGTVTINGGTVKAVSRLGAGIGGSYHGHGGTITITGGTITTWTDWDGAGIGGGRDGHGGAITITGGTVTATGGPSGGAGIGGGLGGTSGTVRISGGKVTATCRSGSGAGIGSGGISGSDNDIVISGGMITVQGGPTGVGIGGTSGGSVVISGGSVKVNGGISTPKNSGGSNVYLTEVTLDGAGEASVDSFAIRVGGVPYVYGTTGVKTDANGKLYFYLPADASTTLVRTTDGAATPTIHAYTGAITTTNDHKAAGTLHITDDPSSTFDLVVTSGNPSGYSYSGGVLTFASPGDYAVSMREGVTITGDRIRVTGGTADAPVNITLSNVNIDASSAANACAFETASGAVAKLLLEGETTLKSGANKAGLYCPGGTALILADGSGDGVGKLTASGGSNGAGIAGNVTIGGVTIIATGIGSGAGIGGGTVTIDSGTITASGGSGGGAGIGGTTTINGGTVTANGGSNGVGIGGSVTINNGTVTASGGSNGAGIGGGNYNGGGTIVINGGMVTASGGSNGAGIGGGSGGSGGSITINGGTVKATGGSSDDRGGAGIGGGYANSCGTVTINNGTVTAFGGNNSPGIGGGSNISNSGTITIKGGSVQANGGRYGAGIGGGKYGHGGTIAISGGTVKATGGTQGAGIGGGYQNSNGGNTTITGGTITAAGGDWSAGIGGGSGIRIGLGGGYGSAVVIDGGTVKATGKDGSPNIGGGSSAPANGTLKNAGGVDVYLTTVTLNGAADKTALESLVISLAGGDYAYGTKDVMTDADGKLYLYLPAGASTAAARTTDGEEPPAIVTYAGNITTANGHTAAGTLYVQLATPAVLAWDGATPGKAKWSAVDNALRYNVQLYKDGAASGDPVSVASGTEHDFTSVIAATGSGSYTFKVTAVANGTTYSDSEQSAESPAYAYTAPRIATPTSLAWDGATPGKAKWSAVDNALRYSVQLYKDGAASGDPVSVTSGTEYDFTSVIAATGTGSYTFRVTAVANGTTYRDSEQSAESPSYAYTAPRIATPASLAWDGVTPDKAKWSAVDNALRYSVQLYKDGAALGGAVSVTSGAEHDFTSVIAATGTGSYTFKVTAVANGITYRDSEQSAASAAYAYTAPRIATPASLAWDGTTPGKAKWSAVDNALRYSVQLYKDGAALGGAVSVASGAEHDFTSAIAAAGTGGYTFKVTAVANGTTYRDSEQSAESPAYAYTAPRIATPESLAWDAAIPGKAKWSAVDNALRYSVQLYKDGAALGSAISVTSGAEHDFTSAIAATGTGGYTFKVTAVANGITYRDSEQSAESPAYAYTAPRIATPASLAWDAAISGKAKWSAVDNALRYSVQLYKDGAALGGAVSVASGAEHGFTSAIAAAGTGSYTFKVTAVANGTTYRDSEQSAESPVYAYTAYTITASAGGGGSISPSGAVTVSEGGNQTFAIKPNTGYAIQSVKVDGREVGPVGSYAFYGVAADHTISVTFRNMAEDYRLRTLSDPSTGISASGILHEDAQITVKPLALHLEGACAACDAIRKAQRDRRLILGLDISLTHDFIAPLTISIPVGDAYNGQTVTILHCADGKLEVISARVVNGMASFKVTSLSPFGVMGGLYPGQLPDPPRTGDATTAAGYAMLGAAALFALVLAMRRRKA